MWSVGCIFAEMLTSKILFRKKEEVEQMKAIYELLGEPQKRWPDIMKLKYWDMLKPKKRYQPTLVTYFKQHCPKASEQALSLLNGLLDFNPERRLSANEALNHPFFTERPEPCNKKELMKEIKNDGREFHYFSMDIQEKKKRILTEKNLKKKEDYFNKNEDSEFEIQNPKVDVLSQLINNKSGQEPASYFDSFLKNRNTNNVSNPDHSKNNLSKIKIN